jgi:hypothetical protein
MKIALDIWPALPIFIDANFQNDAGGDIIGALEDRDRIVGISLWGLTQSKLKKCLKTMQRPFPDLTSLNLSTEHGRVTCAHVNTDTFLGGLSGSIPRLKRLSLSGIQFSALPTLLSSASGLVDLDLADFPVTGRGHISPEAMTICLSSLTRLRSLSIHFRRRPDFTYPTSQHPPPSSLAPTVLQTLTNLVLEGPHEYLESLLSQIDTPLLEDGILELYDAPDFDGPQIPQFIHRTGMFSNSPCELDVYIRNAVSFQLLSSIGPKKKLWMSFSGSNFALDLYTEVEVMEQFCTRCPPLLSHIERLKLADDVTGWYAQPFTAPWLEFLQQFTAVQTLCLCGPVIVPDVSRTLGELAEERATEVLPALNTLVLSWSRKEVSEAARLVEPFIVARKHSEHPVIVERTSPWIGDSDSSDAE